MEKYKSLKIAKSTLEKCQLEKHLEKLASSHSLTLKTDENTYPIPNLLQNFKIIEEVYKTLNENIKMGIEIHPGGEWLLDNFYIIDEIVKVIQKELPLKKYVNFVGIVNGEYKGFARIYVLASEIIAHVDNKIDRESLEAYIAGYQNKKKLNMDEIWNIGIFMQIALIQNIAELCLKIYSSQLQKIKAENIAERLVENKKNDECKFKNNKKIVQKSVCANMGYPFIEYMSYILKRYGKKANLYFEVLEEITEKLGVSVSEVIKKEHFEVANQRFLIGNAILSLKEIQRINFLEIFEKLSGVEEILNADPVGVYIKMDHKTKDYYRNKIKEISKKSKISEVYIAKKMLELAIKNFAEFGYNKKAHIGYYLIDEGINDLYKKIDFSCKFNKFSKNKVCYYIFLNLFLSLIICFGFIYLLSQKIFNIYVLIVSFLFFIIPSSEIAIQLIQYILGKIVKPKLMPKIDFSSGINQENATIVVIPTILDGRQKVEEMYRNLEQYYLANKSKNLYFALLGDCTQSNFKEEKVDAEIVSAGLKCVKDLNKKYGSEMPIFYFLYRKREWNEKENFYLGWERKRGLLNQFNDYILYEKNDFLVNTIEENIEELKNIKYVITLDADTDLILNSAFELVGAMAHILNKPVIDSNRNIVVEGHAIIQPRVGINLDVTYRTLFTKIFAGNGGIDTYSNAISDVYQDNFGEGIFTGKGIYDISAFSQVLKDRIPENKVLSHDLLEGNYLRCGLASDILLMDGYPTKYNSYITRMARWIRGDWQIIQWLKSPLNTLSKYKIFDNLRRSLVDFDIVKGFAVLTILEMIYKVNCDFIKACLLFVFIFPYFLELVNYIIGRKSDEEKQKCFTNKIDGIKGIFLRLIIEFGCLPYKAYICVKSIIITIYRLAISHKNLLQWITSEEAEKNADNSVISYVKSMYINMLFGIFEMIEYVKFGNVTRIFLAILWLVMPFFMFFLSEPKLEKRPIESLSEAEKKKIFEIAKRTWLFFEKYLTKENNFLITDNYQEGRKNEIVKRTSSTNIGLSMIAVISACDLEFIKTHDAIILLKNILNTINSLQKWNGHLYNWYEIENQKPLSPRYISTVDSGNFVGYLYVVKSWLAEIGIKIESDGIFDELDINKKDEILQIINELSQIVDNLIINTNFKYLYDEKQKVFSIGFNIEENKLTNSYYDLLASEARQASLIAIAKKDISEEHWNFLGRTLIINGKYKGLVSWGGTAFEYLMPNINIPKYKGSLLDESCKFMVMNQIEYSKKFDLPWGMTETAFNLKDLNGNYQYKAFGIPWIGLKRGLADDMVVAPYGSIMAITDFPKEVMKNLEKIDKYGVFNKYGYYESIDFTPDRLEKNSKASVVKCYMAHHQSLILLSINNLINENILQKRFMKNPEIAAVKILLQERMPETAVITRNKNRKIEKLKYNDTYSYIEEKYDDLDNRLVLGNVISNGNYVVAINQKGEGFSKYKDIYINRFKRTEDYSQGIFCFIKNRKSNKLIRPFIKNKNATISFAPDKIEQKFNEGNLKGKIRTIVVPDENVEIRNINLENLGKQEAELEVISYFEPILSRIDQDNAHPVFNNLFLKIDVDEETKSLLLTRKSRGQDENEIFMAVNFYCDLNSINDFEYEIDKEKFWGRKNLDVPEMVQNSEDFSKKLGLVTEPIVALKRIVKIKSNEKNNINLVISVGENKDKVLENIKKYKIGENVKKAFILSKSNNEAKMRYLRVNGKQISNYRKMLSYIIFDNPCKKINLLKNPEKAYKQSELWKYGVSGDLPIVLVKIKDVNDIHVVKEALKAHEYMRVNNIETELVILNEEKYSYENYVEEGILEAILNSQLAYLRNVRGGIFQIFKHQMDGADEFLFEFFADIIIDASEGGIENSLKTIEEEFFAKYE